LLQSRDPCRGLRPAPVDQEAGAVTLRPLGPRTLRGRFIALEPFEPGHDEELRQAASDDTFRYFAPPDYASWLAKTLGEIADRRKLCFTVRRLSDGIALGSTSYFDISEPDKRLEIGSTWHAAEVRGTAVNPEAKLLLLTNA